MDNFTRNKNKEDEQLVKLVQEGNPEAFGILVQKYRLRIYSLIHRYLRNNHDCNDVAQEIFIAAYRGIYNFRAESSFYTWLYRIGKNTCIKFLNKENIPPIFREEDARTQAFSLFLI